MAKYKCGDRVFFHLNDREYEYSVTSSFLHNCGGDNAEIFTDLGMNEQEKMDFCSKAFGYRAKSGCCPCSNVNDYEALSRLIEAIEAECAKHSKTYKFDDRVIFTVDGKDYKYTVQDAWLSNPDGRNDEIFSVLGLDKTEFCTKAYGYPANDGGWPECHDRDLDALNRVIKALQEEIAKRPVETALIKTEDKIVFSGGTLSALIEYKVKPKFLHALVGNNDRLFKELKMDQPEKVAYCNKAYGYDARNLGVGSWPEYKSNDYKVLPKLFDNLIADYGLTITINDKPYKGLKITGDIKYAEATTEDIKTLVELKSKLDKARLLDQVPSITKNLLYSNLSRITTTTPVVFTLKDKTLRYTFHTSWLAINGSPDGGNGVLFKELGIRDIAQDLATACYGYTAGGGAWPDYHLNDKKALLRFLYVLSKEYDVKISIDGALLGSYVWSSLTGCATKIEASSIKRRVQDVLTGIYYNEDNFDKIVPNAPIVFKVGSKEYNYIFGSRWCTNATGRSNNVLFYDLGLSTLQTHDLAEACYGYRPTGDWPTYHEMDVKAFLRLLFYLFKAYDVEIRIAGRPLVDFIDNKPFALEYYGPYDDKVTSSEESKDIDLTADLFDDDAIASEATCTEHSFYDAEVLAFKATTLVDRSKLLNHRSPEISLTINHFSLKF